MKTQVGFAHDLEDSWYVVKYNDSVKEFNHYKDVVDFIMENNLSPYEWVGDDYYNPEKDLRFKTLEQFKESDYKSKFTHVRYKLIDTITSFLEDKYNSNLIIENPVNHNKYVTKIYGLNNKVIKNVNLYKLSNATQTTIQFSEICDIIITIEINGISINKFRYDESLVLLDEIMKAYGRKIGY